MIVEVTPGVLVGIAERPAPSGLDADLDDVRGLPSWRRRERLAARGLLREILRRLEPRAASAAVVDVGHGRPAMAGWPGIGVSLAHDGPHVAAAAALGRSVGVDVAQPADHPRPAMLRRCVRVGRDRVEALPEPARAVELARVWSVQEACVKATGDGLAGRPWAIDVPAPPGRGRWGRVEWVALDDVPVPAGCAWTVPPDGPPPGGTIVR